MSVRDKQRDERIAEWKKDPRCEATTRRGTRCALHSPPGFRFCTHHARRTPEAR